MVPPEESICAIAYLVKNTGAITIYSVASIHFLKDVSEYTASHSATNEVVLFDVARGLLIADAIECKLILRAMRFVRGHVNHRRDIMTIAWAGRIS